MELYIVEYIVMYIYSVYIRYKLLVCHMDFHRKSSTFIFLLSNAYFPPIVLHFSSLAFSLSLYISFHYFSYHIVACALTFCTIVLSIMHSMEDSSFVYLCAPTIFSLFIDYIV